LFVRLRAAAAFVVVCVQGYLGGKRVNDVSVWIGALHGVLAQLFFALMVAIAAYLSPTYRGISAGDWVEGDRRRRALTTAALHTTIIQLVFGAIYRHVGQAKGSMHALWTHAGFSVVVVVVTLMAGFALRARPSDGSGLCRTLRRVGTGMLAVVMIQFLLGWGAFITVLQVGARGEAPLSAELATAAPVPAYAAFISTAHQANGALLLALATLGAAFMRQLWRVKKRADQAPLTSATPGVAAASPPGV
jgi:heme A synthase